MSSEYVSQSRNNLPTSEIDRYYDELAQAPYFTLLAGANCFTYVTEDQDSNVFLTIGGKGFNSHRVAEKFAVKVCADFETRGVRATWYIEENNQAGYTIIIEGGKNRSKLKDMLLTTLASAAVIAASVAVVWSIIRLSRDASPSKR